MMKSHSVPLQHRLGGNGHQKHVAHCRMAEGSGLGGLATFSRGFGDERYVSVMREGSQPRRVRPWVPSEALRRRSTLPHPP